MGTPQGTYAIGGDIWNGEKYNTRNEVLQLDCPDDQIQSCHWKEVGNLQFARSGHVAFALPESYDIYCTTTRPTAATTTAIATMTATVTIATTTATTFGPEVAKQRGKWKIRITSLISLHLKIQNLPSNRVQKIKFTTLQLFVRVLDK